MVHKIKLNKERERELRDRMKIKMAHIGGVDAIQRTPYINLPEPVESVNATKILRLNRVSMYIS